MCGITAAISKTDVTSLLLEGLKRLEYRGYDSAGIAVIDKDNKLLRKRVCGKVQALAKVLAQEPLCGNVGIAHTRWATHGKPSVINAHPHFFSDKIALAHNGIIENFEVLREKLQEQGLIFESDTDTEVIVQYIGYLCSQNHDFFTAVKETVKLLEGAYALVVLSQENPDQVIAVRKGSPLVVGHGVSENFVASDPLALSPLTENFVVLEEGDIAQIFHDQYIVYDRKCRKVNRQVRQINFTQQFTGRGEYRHFMQKEIFEQPNALQSALEGRIGEKFISDNVFGQDASRIFDHVKAVQIIACGTSFHAGLVAKHWIEEFAQIPCFVDIASEFRYRKQIVLPGTLLVTLSQSGETADTLEALRVAQRLNYLCALTICNVPESSLVREADLVFLTQAGPEIGVASTKAFTSQLVALLMLASCLGRRCAGFEKVASEVVQALKVLPESIKQVLEQNQKIEQLSQIFAQKNHALFIGRGIHYPIAKEGALKIKEVSYIHAESYPAGELKHGPLALIDKDMPVVALVPNDHLVSKMRSNLQEIIARGGELLVFCEKGTAVGKNSGMSVVELESVPSLLSPIIFTIPLQLLAYSVALAKGTDVDQPRNLAKSVTVE